MRSLLRYLKAYRLQAVLAPLFKMLEATFELFVPLVVASMIDRGITGGDRALVFRQGGLLLLLAVIGLVCSVTAQYFSARAAVGFSTDVKSALFKHLQSLSYEEIDNLGTSAMITRMTSDMNQVQNGVNLTLRLLLRSPFVVFGAMIMAFTVNAKAAVTFAVMIPLLCVVVFGIMLYNIPMYRKVQGALDQVLKSTRENLTGARVVRAFNQQEQEIEDYGRRTDALNRIQLLAGRVSSLMNPVTYVIVNLAVVFLIHKGAISVNSGDITQGELTALVNYMSQILVELVKMASLIITITRAVACARRVQSVFDIRTSFAYGDREREDSREETEKTPVLELSHAGICYRNAGAPSLSDISLSILPGQMIGIIGGTGSGKTTLVNLMARFYDATEGSVSLYGHPIREYSGKALRKIVGVVPQKAVLFHGTIADNLRWGKKDATEEEMLEALRIARAEDFVLEKPEGLQTVLSQEGKNLSGGQRQRLTIARTLIGKPDILILDDSSSALDYATDAALRTGIMKMKDRPVLVIVSQRASSIQYADQILVLEDGHAAGLGTHSELMETCPVYQEIYESQFPKEGVEHV